MSKYGKLCPVSFGFALGLISGLGWMLTCWAGAHYGFGLPIIGFMNNLYSHIAPTWVGGLWAFFWGFLHMFIFGVLSALVYNCSCKCCCSSSGECKTSCK